MRLLSHRLPSGESRLAVATTDDHAIDVDDILGDGSWTMARLLEGADAALERIERGLAVLDRRAGRPIASLDLQAPVPRPGTIIAAGRNYRDHAAEEHAVLPDEPLLFAKLPGSVVGPNAAISWSATLTAQVDYEAELAVVIGRRARDVDRSVALDQVLGYTCLNDVSARDLQVRDGQWTRAKGLDTFCPMGPWLVTVDEIADPSALHIECRVNGETRQDASTSDLVHDVADLIAHCSRSFTLQPGDVIATGTPGGVGAFRDPPVFLADGDVVEVEIERIGVLRNPCRVIA